MQLSNVHMCMHLCNHYVRASQPQDLLWAVSASCIMHDLRFCKMQGAATAHR
jgi:hypothetical protein